MYKLSSEISGADLADKIDQYLQEQCLVCWSIEKNEETGSYALCGYFDSPEDGKLEAVQIQENFPEIELPVGEVLQDQDWKESYKKFVRPWQCGELLWVPSWMKGQLAIEPDLVPIYIEPGMAFGTGMHETTRVCAQGLVTFCSLYEKSNDLVVKNCLDIGCGTGILGISAIKLGLSHAVMIDLDEDAVRICKENAKENGIFQDQMEFIVGDVKVALLGREADLVFANILSPVLLENRDLLINSTKPGGMLCLSGILTSEEEEIIDAFTEEIQKIWGGHLQTVVRDGEWSGIFFLRGEK